jgi:signal transduction histidine kinase
MLRVTLAQRLLVAIGILTVATTAALGFGVREAWRRTEELRFKEQFAQAFQRLKQEFGDQVRDLPALIDPVCEHDPMVDSALVGLKRGDLDQRRLSLSLRVPELMKALRLDELELVTSDGEILGAGQPGLVGKRDAALAALLAEPARAARLRTARTPLAVEAHCKLPRSGGRPWVGLYAARHVDSLLRAVGSSYGVRLSLDRSKAARDDMVQAIQLPEFGGMTIVASKSRVPLHRALEQLDWTILALGGATFGAALLVAMLLARGLARPIVNLSRQAREVVTGEPKPVQGGGGRELREFAESFNQAIADLVALRKRLAATERIAARREIARQVAHEIKNPLAPIRAAVETLRRLRARGDPAFDEYFDEATRTVLEEVERISNIVSEFTRFARLPPPKPAPLDLAETVRKVVDFHAGGPVRVVLETERCPVVRADRDQVVQVVTNLVQNALDAAARAPEPRVVVELKPLDADRIALSVRDNGPGVAPEMRERLFEPYATNKPEGTGLGLAIVQRIVIEHGGEIQYAEAPGGGALFTVVLLVSGPPEVGV